MKKSAKKKRKKSAKKSVNKSANKSVNKSTNNKKKKSTNKSVKSGVKKSVIAFFYLGCLCIALIPVMVYILWPLIFIYIFGAAIFFFLSRELVVMFSMKIISVIKQFADNVKSYIKIIFEKNKDKMRINKPSTNVEKISQASSIATETISNNDSGFVEGTIEQPITQNKAQIAQITTQPEPVVGQAIGYEEEHEHYDDHYPHEEEHVYYDEQYTEEEHVYHNEYAEEQVYEEPNVGRTDFLQDLKNGFSSVISKAKNGVSFLNSQRKQTSSIGEIQETSVTFENMPSNANRWMNSNRDIDKINFDTNHDLNDVKNQLDDLDMITSSAIALMLSDTREKSASPYIRTVKKPDVRVLLLKFLQDTYFATDIEQINELFNKSYYKRHINKNLRAITVFIRQRIEDTLPRKGAMRIARQTKNKFIEKACETINSFENLKYITALSENEEISSSRRNYKLDHLNENYKDAMIYLMDILLTCTCISKMLFVERMIKNMDENSEFNQIIKNMALSINNHNVIINKSRPIYKQYYQAELGYINGDDLLYGMAITIMVNRIRKVDFGNIDILYIDTNYNTANELAEDMYMWLDEMAKHNVIDNIGTLILQKITLSVRGNYGLLTTALQELTNWENVYNQRVQYYLKELDKERYLKGDFDEEEEELQVRVRK